MYDNWEHRQKCGVIHALMFSVMCPCLICSFWECSSTQDIGYLFTERLMFEPVDFFSIMEKYSFVKTGKHLIRESKLLYIILSLELHFKDFPNPGFVFINKFRDNTLAVCMYSNRELEIMG